MPEPEILTAVRVVALPEAIASIVTDGIVLQTAPDEVLILAGTSVDVADPHAVVVEEDGYVGVEMTREDLFDWCRRECEWPLPDLDSFFVQGAVAGLAVKLWVEGTDGLVIARTSLAHDLQERL